MVVGAIAVSASALFFNAGDLLKTMGRDPTLTGRTEIWHLVIGMDRNPILGTGFESFWLGKRLEYIWNIYWWHPNEAHDGYLEVYLNLGWVGIAFLGMLIVSCYLRVVAACRRAPEGSLLLAYFVVTATYNLTEAAFRMLHPVWIFFLIATVAAPESVRVLHKARKAAALKPISTEALVPHLENA
jgi:O-antigen ligase